MHATYLIPEPKVEGFKAKLDKLARKAKKLGAGAVFYTLAKTFNVPHPDVERAEAGEVLVIEAYTVGGTAPRLNGWEFAATLQHEMVGEESITLIRSHADYDLPERFRAATPDDCDHCQTRRYRNDTFVVRNVESGEFKQVGRQCLKDFLGYHKSPTVIADFATQLVNFFDELDSESGGWGGGHVEIAFDVGVFLARTSVCIDDNGWTSRTKARELENEGQCVLATADYVWSYLTAKTEAEKRNYPLPTPTSATFEEVEAALAWLAEQKSDNDYIYNCQAIVKLGRVTHRTAGYLASVVSSYRRAQAKRLYKKLLTADGTDHVGEVGKRSEMLLTLLAVIPIEGDWGTSYLHKFADVDGNAVTWFASNPDTVPCSIAHPHPQYHGEDYSDGEGYKTEMTKGATYRVVATVKEHGHYEGQAQTKVTRISVKPIAPKPKRRRRKKGGTQAAELS